MKNTYIWKFCVVFFFVVVPFAFASEKQDIDPWRLRAFKAMVMDDLSVCSEDKYCLNHVRYYRSVICIANLCEAKGIVKDKTTMFAECAPNFYVQYPLEQQVLINAALCSLFNSPSAITRRAYLNLVVDEGEDEAVELGGYLMALRGSADSCMRYIKGYVGPYGSKWNFSWYRALSGCRILARTRTSEQEEKDFNTWTGVSSGVSHCSDIINREMQRACKARGATSPEPVYDLLW